MKSVFDGDIEVLVLKGGHEFTRVKRPLRQTPLGPAVMYKRRLWPVNDSTINLDGATLEDSGESEKAGDQVLTAPAGPAPAGPHRDLQEEVISALPEQRLLVDAGPGTGKTHVACARVAHLIRQGISPGRIWIVSFTRTAVHEIRNRLIGALDEEADAIAVRIATLDSHAWAMQSGFSGDAFLTASFNDSIEATTARILGDEEVQDYLMQRVSHLIVDEAQDIVGSRAELLSAMINALSPDCGVTVFADRAQAIYGFTEEIRGPGTETSLLEKLNNSDFNAVSLVEVHRTSEPGLLKIFTDVRREVLDCSKLATERGPIIRREIERLAGHDLGAASDISFDNLNANTLVLMRRRCDVLTASNKLQDTPHRLRMSGLPPRIYPWVGELLWDFTERRLTRTQFKDRWARQVTTAKGDEANCRAWNLLLETAGESDTIIDIHRLRTVLARSNPPSLFTSPEYGDSGPILGTIHASKGREADDVHLYLPPEDADENLEGDLDEEMRVMFVGATRAKHRLFVGKSLSRWSGNYNGRVWRRTGKGGLQFEVGRVQDLDVDGLVGRSGFPTGAEALAAQRIVNSNPTMTKLFAHTVRELEWRIALRTSDQTRFCFLSHKLAEELYAVTKLCGRKVMPQYLPFIRSIGLRTMAVGPEDAALERLHSPWCSSGFVLAPMLTGLSTTKFPKGKE